MKPSLEIHKRRCRLRAPESRYGNRGLKHETQSRHDGTCLCQGACKETLATRQKSPGRIGQWHRLHSVPPATYQEVLMSFQGKYGLITGSSRGIGLGIALKLSGKGACAAVHYFRNQEAAHATLEKIRA